MTTITLDTGYRPRPLQAELHRRLKRFNVLVCHRRFGKTVLCINELIDRALRSTRKNPRFAYIAPLYKQAKTVAWQYLKDYSAPLLPYGATANETELRVDYPNGAQVRLYGADNPDALRGIYLDGVVLDEPADMNPRLWPEVIRPALADREGFAIFIGTPKGRNAFFDLWERAQGNPDWLAYLCRASESGVLPAAELRAAKGEMDPEQYEQEFECSFNAALVGAYYGRLLNEAESEGRIKPVAWDPALPVHTAWDLGRTDDTVIWFYQMLRGEVRLIDYYAMNGVGVAHYAKLIQGKPYVYGRHWLPHDATAKTLAAERSTIEQLHALGVKASIVADIDVQDGIQSVRALLPRCWFEAEKCKPGLEALRQYQREWDADRKTFKPSPLHDWASHAADAFRYLAVSLREEIPELKPKGINTRLPTMNELAADIARHRSNERRI